MDDGNMKTVLDALKGTEGRITDQMRHIEGRITVLERAMQQSAPGERRNTDEAAQLSANSAVLLLPALEQPEKLEEKVRVMQLFGPHWI